MPIKIKNKLLSKGKKSLMYSSLSKTYVIAISLLFLFGNINLLADIEIITLADESENLGERDTVWDIQLSFNEPGGYFDYVTLGAATDAVDGPPQDDYDAPKPPNPLPPCIYAWFDDNLDAPYDLLSYDCRTYNNVNYKEWNLSVMWMNYGGGTDINISWSTNDFGNTEYDTVILYYINNDEEINMFTHSYYEFSCPAFTIQDFIVNCTIFENLDPKANFTFEPANPSTSDLIYFNSTSYDPDGNITNWEWDFGDNSSMSLFSNVTHQYNESGSYIVNLTVTDDNGLKNSTEEIVSVSNSPPDANFNFEPGSPLTSDLIYINSTSSDFDGYIVNWTWDFDDGSFGYGEKVIHQYIDDGSYNVELTVTDDEGATNTNTSTINVNNVPPTAVDDINETLEDNSVIIDILTNDYDTDGVIDPTTVEIIDDVDNGTTSVDLVTGNVTYTPEENYHGPDSFTYTVNDDDGNTSNNATVNITIISVNDAPIANDDTASTDENTAVLIEVLENDEDDGGLDPTTVSLEQDVDHGETSINPTTGVITYTPEANYTGSDSFSYKVNDIEGLPSNVAIVNITILPYNDPPIAEDDNATTSEDSSINIDILANDNDTDGEIDPATVIIDDDVGHGEISINTENGEVTYTPDENYHGTDSFTYTVNDTGGAQSNNATVSIVITSVNDNPIAEDDMADTTINTLIFIDVCDNDYDIDGYINLSTVTISDGVDNGNTSINPISGEVIYTPNTNFTGIDSFSYYVYDNETAPSNIAIVNISVGIENNEPIANDDFADTDEDKVIWIDVLDNDYDTDGYLVNSTITITSGPIDGSTSVNTSTGEIRYTPDTDFHGEDIFYYTVNDDDGETSNEATVTITINSVPDAPKFFDASPTGTGKDISIDSLSIRIEDPEGDIFDWSITTFDNIGNNSQTGASNNTMICNITSSLSYSTEYYWTVYAVDEHGINNSHQYSFTTKVKPGGGGGDPGGGGPSIPPQPPKPTAEANGPYSGVIGEEIQFNASGSSAYEKIENYTWSFGDGETSYGLNPIHSYNTIGTFKIILTVKDNFGGTDTDETTALISQPNRAPSNPDISGPPRGTKNEKYSYAAVAIDKDNDNVQYIFDWGDETQNKTEFLQNGTEVNFSHVWTSAGMYTIGVRAYDNQTYSEITKLTVLIDAYVIKDLGYLTDDDTDGIYDMFHSGDLHTSLGKFEGKYLIDTGGNGEWNVVFDIVTGEVVDYEGEITPDEDVDFTVIVLLTFSSLIILGMAFYLVNTKKKQSRRFRK